MFFFMCGRFRNPRDLSKLAADYGVKMNINFPFDPNVAPTETSAIFRTSKREGRKLQLARFGLLPPKANSFKSAYATFNARADTLLTKPLWKQSYQAGRFCVIPAEGFYEWREERGLKQPYFFFRKDNELMQFAGLWNFSEVQNEKVYSFTIITTDANEISKPYHHRMPVILTDPETWLKAGDISLLKPYSGEACVRPVSSVLNKAQIKDITAIDALSQ